MIERQNDGQGEEEHQLVKVGDAKTKNFTTKESILTRMITVTTDLCSE